MGTMKPFTQVYAPGGLASIENAVAGIVGGGPLPPFAKLYDTIYVYCMTTGLVERRLALHSLLGECFRNSALPRVERIRFCKVLSVYFAYPIRNSNLDVHEACAEGLGLDVQAVRALAARPDLRNSSVETLVRFASSARMTMDDDALCAVIQSAEDFAMIHSLQN